MRLPIPEIIRADNLLLQRLRYEDAEEIFFGYASKDYATRYVSWPTHQSLRDTRAYLQYARAAWDAGTDYSFSIRLTETRRLVGSIGAVNQSGSVQFGYFICPSQWGRGYAVQAARMLLGVLKNIPEVFRIWTFVDAENTASIRVLEKCGLTEEARKPAYYRFVNQQNRAKDCIIFRLER